MSEDEEITGAITPEQLRALPTNPGVYLMKDGDGTILYIGKAKNLRNRVRSYFSGSDERYRVTFLLRRVTNIETLVTDDERQALILEADLVRRHQPRYNIRLKDDKSHLLVRIDFNHEWPRIELVRFRKDDGARYLGPFAFGYELRALLDVVRESFPLRTCSDRVIYNRVRPCLEFQMKRCAAPCCLPVDREQYSLWLQQSMAVLEGRDMSVVAELEKEMEHFAAELQFEEAARIRDRLEVLKRVTTERPTLQISSESQDAIGVFRDGERLEFSVVIARGGRLVNSKTFGFDSVELPTEEYLTSFLMQYYVGGEDIPTEILLSSELADEAALTDLLSERLGRRVTMSVPVRGPKVRLLRMAQENAQEGARARLGAETEQDAASRDLAQQLGLDQVPRTIECVDVSHFQGGQTVAAVVHFKDGRPDKSRYRRFQLSAAIEGKPDDFASMREVVGRHISRCMEEGTLPDLFIVDGGPAQLSQAIGQRKELGISEPTMVGLAKKRNLEIPYRVVQSLRGSQAHKPERVYLEDDSRVPIVLRPGTKALQLMERIRDEAHRFVITFHRSKRMERTFRSVLDDIPGIGPNRRKQLLRAFGSVKMLRLASAEDIAQKTGVPKSLADRIVERLAKKPEE